MKGWKVLEKDGASCSSGGEGWEQGQLLMGEGLSFRAGSVGRPSPP